jgi:hypothetical protein
MEGQPVIEIPRESDELLEVQPLLDGKAAPTGDVEYSIVPTWERPVEWSPPIVIAGVAHVRIAGRQEGVLRVFARTVVDGLEAPVVLLGEVRIV